jgi:small subunit ribosomal protein S3
MGQKVHPIGIRLGITKEPASKWYRDRDFAATLAADIEARAYLKKELAQALVGRIEIERPGGNAVRIRVFAARPGVALGKKGEDVDKLRDKLSRMLNVPVHITIEEIRKPEMNAELVAESVAQQLERRIMFRRAMRRAVTSALRAGAKGIKIAVAGRLGGTEIARTEWYREGRVPLHTLRADIDYATAEAKTTYGIIGVKVWIFKGEAADRNEQAEVAAEAATTK